MPTKDQADEYNERMKRTNAAMLSRTAAAKRRERVWTIGIFIAGALAILALLFN